MNIKRCKKNPIVRPGIYDWRKVVTFNPAVIIENDKFYMLERVSGGLQPFHCYFGLMESDNGIDFTHVVDYPVVTPEMLGFSFGSIQDPRIVKLEDTFYLNYALRPSSYGYAPTGVGKPIEIEYTFPGDYGKAESFMTRSGIMKSKDLIHWEQVAYTTPFEINDRDNILFPEKIKGRYALLRRPEEYIGETYGTDKAAIWLTYSDDLIHWDEPKILAKSRDDISWEYKKIGGSTPPIKTEEGWLVIYHGVDEDNVYRAGVMMLDLENPMKVIARPEAFILEPEEYYEKFGLYIPNVVFPTGNVVKDGLLYIYYGCTDTAISLATVPLKEIVDFVMGR
jgi:predicted GH43/DUF377 family glycosyl hydrolase